MTETFIPFNYPARTENEQAYIAQALASHHLSGDGEFTRKCHALLQELVGVPKALLTTSCTHALEMSALLLGIREGDEVIVPSFTFVSTVNAFVLRGARPVFADIHLDTLNLDERQLEGLITERTKAIYVVHYAGVGCEMDEIMRIAEKHNLPIVEDNAHGLFGKYKGRNLGTFGTFATQSFHETKNISCGEGGALLLNDERYFERAEILREKGTNRSRFFRGQVDKYTWVDQGSSYLPSELLAAVLLSQLESWQLIQHKRRSIWQQYDAELRVWAAEIGARQPYVPAHCEQPAHMYYLLMPSLDIRTRFIQHLKAHNIMAVFHYLPLHLSDMGLRFGGQPGDCPVTEDVSDRLVRLPLYYNMLPEETERVIEAALEFKP